MVLKNYHNILNFKMKFKLGLVLVSHYKKVSVLLQFSLAISLTYFILLQNSDLHNNVYVAPLFDSYRNNAIQDNNLSLHIKLIIILLNARSFLQQGNLYLSLPAFVSFCLYDTLCLSLSPCLSAPLSLSVTLL